jgi:hypothetical protein
MERVWQPLHVITLATAMERYDLSEAELARAELLLAGKERRLISGLTGYYTADIEQVLAWREAA